MSKNNNTFERVFGDGTKVTVENGWSILYDTEGNEITRSLAKYYFNNPHGYNLPGYDEMAEKIHQFWLSIDETGLIDKG
jgi:hypothetical protein